MYVCVCARSCSVIYLVPYIHSDNIRRQPTRARTPGVLHERRTCATRIILRTPDASLPTSGWAWVSANKWWEIKYCAENDSEMLLKILFFCRYTGSYNYSSYANQHHHAIQSQYSSLTHEAGLPTPLHYSSYHRTSAQVRILSQNDQIMQCWIDVV